MCEYCGPTDGKHERVRPDLLAEMRRFNEVEAARRGLTMEEFQDGDYLVSPKNRIFSWFEDAWVNLRLLKPGL